MGEPVLIDQLAGDIWNVYVADTANAETNIENLLDSRLAGLPADARREVLLRLRDAYQAAPDSDIHDLFSDNRIMSRIFSLLLGKDISPANLSPSELIQKLAESLNTIFDSLNHLIRVINKTLYGKRPEKPADDKTIRQVIGSHLTGNAATESIEDHLKQINQAFLISQQAFKTSVRATLARVLKEIDPEMLDLEAGRGFLKGVFHRARLFDAYTTKYTQIKKWFESDRVVEDFLREFEKNCRELTKS